MSVVSSVEHLTADSPLLDTQEDTIQDSRLRQWIQNSTTSSQIDSEESDVEAGSVGEFVPVTPILVASTIERAPSLEADALIGRDTPSPEATDPPLQTQVWEIGQAVESDRVPLLYCCRRLVTGFLLPDNVQSVRVRVSVRALALQCLTQLMYIHPPLFFCSIDVNNQTTEGGFSHVSDVLYLASHSDHQLRGLCCILVGSFVRSALLISPSTFHQWVEGLATGKIVSLDKLMLLLVTGLQDESSVCVRHSLAGLSCCLDHLLASNDHQSAAVVLPVLLRLSTNPYWLVKVKLLELLGELSFLQVHYLTDGCDFQDQALHSVMLRLLGDDDTRVRRAACDAIVRAAQHMYYPLDENGQDIVNSSTLRLADSLLTGIFDRKSDRSNSAVEGTLSRIVSSITKLLFQSFSKHLTAGCCEALCTLSVQFPPGLYTRAWHCFLARPLAESKSPPSATGLLGTVVAMLTASPLTLDLDVHSWLLVLAGNLFTGLAGLDMKVTNGDKTDKQLWSHFSDPKLASLSETLLQHLIRLLCLFVRVLEDAPANKNPTSSPVKRRTTRATSPAKVIITTVEKEGSKEEKGKFGQFAHIPHYNRLHDNLCSAYGSYKTQLECSDKLAGLLRSVLLSLGQLLEYSTLTESGRLAEEVLLYLRTAVSLEPTASVTAVQQLLRSLFGSNKIALWEESGSVVPTSSSAMNPSPSYHDTVLRKPLSDLGVAVEDRDDLSLLQNRLQRDMGSHRKASSIVKGLMKGSDRHALASYIRLFEPMVIQALKQYTVTNNVHLQVAVLSLLTQLVQLRVNYCLLDSDQIFIEFVLKQFDFLEVGQINHPEVLIPKVFEFLVHLSYEKNHSKPVISVAKVIQLCDGLMASGQDPQTHLIWLMKIH
ncbi:hypothetical protein J6590_047234 [Homalodisca vitripennis]|nr:hypothetical protein J6590_047234 [Homalodisca vitripennis]